MIKALSAVAKKAIFVAMFSGHNGGPGWTADGISTKGVLKNCSGSSETIDVWSGSDFGEVAAIGRDRTKGMIIRKEEEDIGLFGLN